MTGFKGRIYLLAKDITGQKYARWTVLGPAGKDKRGVARWFCQCECGTERDINEINLKYGNSLSCGCLNRERVIKTHTKHGMHETRFYNIWRSMLNRCRSPKNTRYEDYGGRGIIVCDNWIKFENFRDDLYEKYLEHVKLYGERNTSIDRLNVDGNYELSNVKWATVSEQSINKRKQSNNTSGFAGITSRDGKWVARINFKGECKYLGRFDTKEEAVKARKQAETDRVNDLDNYLQL